MVVAVLEKHSLIRESYDYDFTFQHAGLSAGGLKDQLFAFCSSLKDSGYSFKRKPENWLEAFEGVKDVIRKSQTEKKLSLLMSFHGWTLQSVI